MSEKERRSKAERNLRTLPASVHHSRKKNIYVDGDARRNVRNAKIRESPKKITVSLMDYANCCGSLSSLVEIDEFSISALCVVKNFSLIKKSQNFALKQFSLEAVLNDVMKFSLFPPLFHSQLYISPPNSSDLPKNQPDET